MERNLASFSYKDTPLLVSSHKPQHNGDDVQGVQDVNQDPLPHQTCMEDCLESYQKDGEDDRYSNDDFPYQLCEGLLQEQGETAGFMGCRKNTCLFWLHDIMFEQVLRTNNNTLVSVTLES